MKNKLTAIAVIAVIIAAAVLIIMHFIKNEKPVTEMEQEGTAAAEQTKGVEVMPRTVDFSSSVLQDESADAEFSVSADEFVSDFNAVYRMDHSADYFTPMSDGNWTRGNEPSLCFGHEAVSFRFSEDPELFPAPTVSLYAPDDGSRIYEIRLTFDDHAYQDTFFEEYRELCFCAEKLMIPNLTDTQAAKLFETLCAQSECNFFGDHYVYGDPERPALDSVYKYKNIGFYCFYGSGNIEICIIPLNPTAVKTLSENGTVILNDQIYMQ